MSEQRYRMIGDKKAYAAADTDGDWVEYDAVEARIAALEAAIQSMYDQFRGYEVTDSQVKAMKDTKELLENG